MEKKLSLLPVSRFLPLKDFKEVSNIQKYDITPI